MEKMHVDASRNDTTIENLNLFYDLELILRLHAILPFLNSMHTLIKLTQSHDVFICDFIDMVKVCLLDLYNLYFDPCTKFDDPTFDEFKAFEPLTSKNLLMSWCEYLSGEEVDCLIIEFFSAKFFVNQHCLTIGALKPMLKPNFPLVMAHVKLRYEDFA